MVQRPGRKAGMAEPLRIGCAGWTVPRSLTAVFPPDGSHLARTGAVFNAVEINTSFYRPHRPATYERWAATVPPTFRFSVKFPKAVTHAAALDAPGAARAFLDEAMHLGDRLGAVLVQLPPSQTLEEKTAARFFETVRARYDGLLACEPRHATWFGPEANRLMTSFHVARVAADPSPLPEGRAPGGWDGAIYYRLHGSPQRYYSSYGDDFLRWLADALRAAGVPSWCIFDNTARGAAPEDALRLMALLNGASAALIQ